MRRAVRAARLRRAARRRRRDDHVLSRRPHPRLGAGADGVSAASASSSPATTSACPTARRSRSSWSNATCWSPRRRSGCRCSSIPTRTTRSRGCCARWRAHPERAHVIGCYALGKAQRVIALLRRGRLRRADLPAWRDDPALRALRGAGHPLGELRHSLDVPKAELEGQIVIAPPSAIKDRWSRRLPDPVLAVASGWMSGQAAGAAVGRRAAAGHLRPCRLERAAPDDRRDGRRARSGSRMGARMRWSTGASSRGSTRSRSASTPTRTATRGGRMKKFAQLLELLALTPSRNRKIEALTRLLRDDARPRSRLCARHPHRRADASRT